ncbi:IS3 family transposase [Rhizobium sp. AB2/73]|uniref:IS3 family transposase n=1 Tax=Rhizobium sp. AB2/73 TaxID=2795216 RepID=UPI001C6033D9|nr:IS3 family transposase [Rhizobium sp. AB2/73]UEQ80385.1 IS3 family transposase [Rhizobium sp. AB2/73]
MDGQAYRDIDDARTRIGEFIEAVYNRQRLHSAVDYLSPEAYETSLRQRRHKTPNAIRSRQNCY